VFAVLRDNLERFPGCVAHNVGLSSSAGAADLTYYPRAAAMSGLHADPEQDRDLVHHVLVNRGASESEATARLVGSFEPEVVRCELTTVSRAIHDLAIARVDLLKVDVEKAELEVLEGIEDADWPKVRQVAMESHDAGGRAAAAAALLRGRGFSVTVEQDPTLRETGLRMVYAIRR
jgi:FkbM family methyltransferase